MKNKKLLVTLLIIVGVLGLLTTSVVFVTQKKISQFLPQEKTAVQKEIAQDELPAPQSGSFNKIQRGQITDSQLRGPSIPRPIPGSGDNALDVDDRVYEKNGHYGLVVTEVDQYMQRTKEYILSIEGRILSSNINTSERYQYGYMRAKVPVAKFEEASQRVTENIDKIVNQQVNAIDKTGQKVELENKLTKLEEEKLDLEIQLEEAETDLEKKRLQLQIKRIENQIEQTKTMQDSLSERIEYATLTITAADSKAYFNPGTYRPSLMEQIKQAWDSMSNLLYIFGYIIIWFGVYSLLWLPLVLLVYFLSKKVMAKNKKTDKKKKPDQDNS